MRYDFKNQPLHTPAKSWLEHYDESLLGVFGTPKKALVRGAGCFVWDEDGHQYLDMLAGIAVNALGHAHPNVINAVNTQMQTLGHVSNFFTTPAQIQAAQAVLSISTPGQPLPDSRVFFTNSGTEANEAAMKIARLHGGAKRNKILALEGAFHGRTLGSLAITYNLKYRVPFEPLAFDVEFLPYGSLAALERALEGANGEKVAALFIEPIQGEVGVRPVSDNYLQLARKATQKAGALLVIDEIQTGVGRSGHWMAHHSSGITPDIITLAKGIGAGFPVGALVTFTQETSNILTPGSHGTTFGGNPIACAAVQASIDTIKEENLVHRANLMGQRLREDIMTLRSPLISEVRGAGLLLGIGFTAPIARELYESLLQGGFITNAPNELTLRLAPPLIISQDQCQMFVSGLAEHLALMG